MGIVCWSLGAPNQFFLLVSSPILDKGLILGHGGFRIDPDVHVDPVRVRAGVRITVTPAIKCVILQGNRGSESEPAIVFPAVV